MTKCEWHPCEAEAEFTIRRMDGTPCMSKQTWRPRWCYRHVVAMLRKGSRERRARVKRKTARALLLAGRPNHLANLRERVRCVDCGRSVQTSKALCALNRTTVRRCKRAERTHGVEPCPAYCRGCAPWVCDDGTRNHGYLADCGG